MKRIAFILSIIITTFVGQAQSNLDSLYSLWQDHNLPDTTRLEAFYKFTWDGYLFSKPDSAFYFARLGYDFAKNKGLKINMAEALNTQGLSFYLRGDNHKASEYLENSLAIYEEFGDKEGIAQTMSNLGIIYESQSNYPKALEYYQKSLVIHEELNNKQGIATVLTGIGMIYDTYADKTKGLEYYQKALVIHEELGEKKGIADALNNIAGVYYEQGNTSKSLEYHQKSLEIRKELNDKHGISASLRNIGVIHKSQNNIPKAMEYYQSSLMILQELNDQNGISDLQTEIGYFYHKQGINSKALEYCKRGLELAQTIEDLYVQKNACQCLYETYKDMGKSNEALLFYEKMIVFKDSMYNDENTKKITRLEMQYDFDKKEAAALAEQEKKDAFAKQELQRQKIVRNVFVGGFALVLIFAGIFFRQRNKISKEKERSESLLLNILPAEIAEELKEKGRADARDFEMVSILFTDFKGFTSASEKLSAQELVTKINTCFEAFDGLVEKYGIEKIKTIGDAYMAAGGLPVPDDDSVKNTVLAALEMQQFIFDHKNKMDAAGKPAFEMRVGVHTGPVVAGIVGVKKFQYDIWGDTVNTASRMESAGEVSKVNISQATFELLKDDPEFTFESRGKVEAKGKGEIEMYFVAKV